jgi:DNA-binding beta-propeller fold protein YncE
VVDDHEATDLGWPQHGGRDAAREAGALTRLSRALGAALLLSLATAASAGANAAVYVPDEVNAGTVLQYEVGIGGQLSPATPATVASGKNSNGVAASPDGRSVYVLSAGDNDVWEYDVGPGGVLSPKTPAHLPAGTTPDGIAVSPDGRSVYVTNQAGSPNVSQYDVGTGGVLSPKTPPMVAAGGSPQQVAVSPDGKSVYVTNFGDHDVSQYDVGAGGTLLPKTPATVAAGMNPQGIAIGPSGGSVYVADRGDDDVSHYNVGPGGILSPVGTVVAGTQPVEIVVSPDGHSVYVADFGQDVVSQYDVGSGGVLSPKTPATVASGSQPSSLAVSSNSEHAYVVNIGGSSISQFDAGSGGVLSPETPGTVAAGTNPFGIAVRPDQGPAAAFVPSPAPAGSATGFDGSSSSDADGSVARFDWVFGDGTAAPNGGPKPTHVFQAPGSYTVTLTVTDDGGCSTAFVFTGQTAACNGNAGAVTTRTVTVPAAASVRLSGLRISPSSFRAAGSGGSIARALRHTGAKISYKDSQTATTTFTVLRAAAGVRHGAHCVATRRRKTTGRRCTRYTAVGSFRHADRTSTNSFHFTGRVRHHKLKSGRYHLRATPRFGGRNGRAVTKSFRIIH